MPVPFTEWPALLHEAMHRNDVGRQGLDAYIRITISRGEGEIGLDPALCARPTVVIIAKALSPLPVGLYQTGVPLTVARTKRNLPEALSPHIKATNFLRQCAAASDSPRIDLHHDTSLGENAWCFPLASTTPDASTIAD